MGLSAGGLRGVVKAPKDGDQVLVHTWMAAKADCDQSAGGVWDAGKKACRTTFLRNSVEISGDGSGNDNGLCESNERCLVTANIGAYQGHGALQSAGNIGAGGKITGVKLFKYAANGY